MRYTVNAMKGRKLIEGLFFTNDLTQAIEECQRIADTMNVDRVTVYDTEIEDVVKSYKVAGGTKWRAYKGF